MKLDFLKDGSEYCPLVRFYDFSGAEAARLMKVFQSLADRSSERVPLDGVESVDGTQITFVRSTWDRGVVKKGKHEFEVLLTPLGWVQAAELAEPFCDAGNGYQWLTNCGKIQLLISRDGSW